MSRDLPPRGGASEDQSTSDGHTRSEPDVTAAGSPQASVDATQVPHLLALADLLLWIAQFLSPPRRGRRVAVVSRSTEADLRELLRLAGLADQGWTARQLMRMERLLGSNLFMMEKSRLFDANVICPADECSYVRRDKGTILADIVGFHRAFGFQLSAEASERADHVSAELELAAMLLVMRVRAGNEDGARVAWEAWILFASDHLGEWLPDFTVRLTQTTLSRELIELAQLLEAVWMSSILAMGMTADRFDGVGGRRTPEASIATGSDSPCFDRDLDTPYECGMAPDPATKISPKGRSYPR